MRSVERLEVVEREPELVLDVQVRPLGRSYSVAEVAVAADHPAEVAAAVVVVDASAAAAKRPMPRSALFA